MKKPNVVFIHGFMSGAESSKWKYLKNDPRWNAFMVEIDYMDYDSVFVLKEIHAAIKDIDDPILVGHSLGGFFARLMGATYGLRTILVNPSMQPHLTLSSGERSLPTNFLDGYRFFSELAGMVRSHIPENNSAELVLIEYGDDVVDHAQQMDFHRYSKVLTDLGGNHSFVQLNKIGQAIEMIQNRPWQ